MAEHHLSMIEIRSLKLVLHHAIFNATCLARSEKEIDCKLQEGCFTRYNLGLQLAMFSEKYDAISDCN